jgi:cysteine desulfuration protein SufE
VKLYDLAEEFADLDPEEKLQLLIEFSEGLPEPSADTAVGRHDEVCRVQECQTAVYLRSSLQGGKVHLEAFVPRQSPTVRGLVALLVEGLQGATPPEVAEMPDDLLMLLGLQETLGMTRQHGMRAVVARIKRETARGARESSGLG